MQVSGPVKRRDVMMDDGGGGVQFIWAIIGFIILFIPFQKIFAKAGFSRAWALLLLIPLLGTFLCWLVLALRHWPAGEGQ